MHFLCPTMAVELPCILFRTFFKIALLSMDTPDFRIKSFKVQHKFSEITPFPVPSLHREIPAWQILPL